jgi:hypothetical protein
MNDPFVTDVTRGTLARLEITAGYRADPSRL